MQFMDKVKEKELEIKDNGHKKKPTKDEMIKQLEIRIREVEKEYHQVTGALAYLKEVE